MTERASSYRVFGDEGGLDFQYLRKVIQAQIDLLGGPLPDPRQDFNLAPSEKRLRKQAEEVLVAAAWNAFQASGSGRHPIPWDTLEGIIRSFEERAEVCRASDRAKLGRFYYDLAMEEGRILKLVTQDWRKYLSK